MHYIFTPAVTHIKKKKSKSFELLGCLSKTSHILDISKQFLNVFEYSDFN